MAWVLTVLLLFALHDPVDTGEDPDTCRCVTVEASDGWCPKCRVGYYAAERIESSGLFKVLDLHGHPVSAEKTKCATCRDAIRDGGFCPECNMGYIDGRGYFARVCYHLAKGRVVVAPASVRKSRCAGSGDWCAACQVGVVGNRAFDDQRNFDDARRFHEVLKSAARAARRCESCAMAMIADSRCPVCRVGYKGGKPVGEPAKGKARPTEPADGASARIGAGSKDD